MESPTPTEVMEDPLPVDARPSREDQPLPILCDESKQERWGWLIIAGAVIALYAIMTLGFWAPADGGAARKGT